MRMLFLGAHPDDPDYYAGGLAKKYTAAGHEVRFVSVTNGDAGHHELRGPQLAERRRRECFMASGVGELEYQVLNHKDGRLQPTLEIRDQLIGMIRQFNPDVVFTHRPWDYHPDHRCVSMLVQDASYMLTVPAISPQTPHLRRMPVICHMEDTFQKPIPLQPEIVVSIDDEIEAKIAMLNCHVSQFYEWLPYNMGILREVPDEPDERLEWLGAITRERCAETANRFRKKLIELYGSERGEAVQCAEAYELCEYGRKVPAGRLARFFPFFGDAGEKSAATEEEEELFQD